MGFCKFYKLDGARRQWIKCKITYFFAKGQNRGGHGWLKRFFIETQKLERKGRKTGDVSAAFLRFLGFNGFFVYLCKR
ncbi:MAG: hypothetical protein ACI4US_02775 [Muribaculaceae bacterium]